MIPSDQALVEGEILLWQGRPKGGLRLRPRDFYMSALGVILVAFSVLWRHLSISQDESLLIQLSMVPFLLAGIYFCFVRHVVDIYIRRHTHYFLTDRRAIIEVDAIVTARQQVMLGSLNEVRLRHGHDGTGSIMFGKDVTVSDVETSRTTYAPSFEFIADAPAIHELVERQRNRAQAN